MSTDPQTTGFAGDLVFVALNFAFCLIFVACYVYQFGYLLVPFFLRDRPHKQPALPHKIAVLVSARNEEAVIKHLLDSLNAQTYAREHFAVFVAADNCTDQTAALARENGAVVYERFNQAKVGKGYALEFLYEKIAENYGENHFDAYLVLDADNVLDPHYLEEMNKTFSDGYEVLTSYRNSKNYGDNWISAGYGLWFLRESEYLNHARMLLGTSCAVSGTGFMFSANVIKKAGGWKFFLLTEDIEFTVYNILNGKKIGYAKDAELFDEQPVTFPQSWRQRLRWAKGYIQVWMKYGTGLLRNIFSPKFSSCYDMTMTIMPALVISILTLVNSVAAVVIGLICDWELSRIGGSLLGTLSGIYFTFLFIGGITTITQWKKIHASPVKKIFYTFTFPVFMLTYLPIAITAIFKRVKWDPITHARKLTFEDIRAS